MIQLTFEFVHQFMYSWILSFKQINRKVISLQNTNTRTTHDTQTRHTHATSLFSELKTLVFSVLCSIAVEALGKYKIWITSEDEAKR
jgi:hypothetical protein